jgi:hypothetical protein
MYRVSSTYCRANEGCPRGCVLVRACLRAPLEGNTANFNGCQRSVSRFGYIIHVVPYASWMGGSVGHIVFGLGDEERDRFPSMRP